MIWSTIEIQVLVREMRSELAKLSPPAPSPLWAIQDWVSLAQTIIDLEKMAEAEVA